jgi:saccharopine dehydrogenase-like NADP-dependent oxidoreductase
VNQILVFGAGRSSLFLIEILERYCQSHPFQLLVCDKDVAYAKANFVQSKNVTYQTLDIFNQDEVEALVQNSSLIVSMLPAALHINIAKLCLKHKKNLATASYVSDDMKALHQDVVSKGLVFLNEIGLDPGIDHMSAMQMMDAIKQKGGKIIGFKSFTGGLIADEDDGDNPWKYKFTWNPRNVVVAAQGPPATYLQDNHIKLMPYHKIFSESIDFSIPNYGTLEGYPNRDSLKYIELYGLHNIKTILRGTLRKPGFCSAWNVFVTLGMTDDSVQLKFPEHTTLNTWLKSYLPGEQTNQKEYIKSYCQCSDLDVQKLEWLGFFAEDKLPLCSGSSAQILEAVLTPKWKLQNDDKDLIVMLHEIEYELNGKSHTHTATLVLNGENSTRTAMAKTVGSPLALGCIQILEDKITQKGVLAPMSKEIYEPVLEQLHKLGIQFIESHS